MKGDGGAGGGEVWVKGGLGVMAGNIGRESSAITFQLQTLTIPVLPRPNLSWRAPPGKQRRAPPHLRHHPPAYVPPQPLLSQAGNPSVRTTQAPMKPSPSPPDGTCTCQAPESRCTSPPHPESAPESTSHPHQGWPTPSPSPPRGCPRRGSLSTASTHCSQLSRTPPHASQASRLPAAPRTPGASVSSPGAPQTVMRPPPCSKFSRSGEPVGGNHHDDDESSRVRLRKGQGGKRGGRDPPEWALPCASLPFQSHPCCLRPEPRAFGYPPATFPSPHPPLASLTSGANSAPDSVPPPPVRPSLLAPAVGKHQKIYSAGKIL